MSQKSSSCCKSSCCIQHHSPAERENFSLQIIALLPAKVFICSLQNELRKEADSPPELRSCVSQVALFSRGSAEAQQRLSRGSAGEAAAQQQSSSRGLSSAERPLQGALQSSSAQQELSRALQRSVGRKGNT